MLSTEEPMARTRSSMDRVTKAEEIVELAARHLRTGGYSGLSVAAIARELRIAQSTIYWYFPTRDHLFVAALHKIEADVRAERTRLGRLDTLDELVWTVEQLSSLGDINAALYERARKAEVVAQYLSAFQDVSKQTIVELLKRDGFDDSSLEDAAELLLLVIDGMFLREVPRGGRTRILQSALTAVQSLNRSPSGQS